jgi:hypothetical protein
MNQVELTRRVRTLTRDFSDSIFREQDIFDFMNEGIERLRQIIPELRGMKILESRTEELILLPVYFHHLVSLYGASRCFTQDERHYQASNLMNEFEFKVAELKVEIDNGTSVIIDALGNEVKSLNVAFHVVDNYFTNRKGTIDFDDGVEGLN